MCIKWEDPVARRPDVVFASVATQLMEATGSTATQVSQKVLAQLVGQFDVDASFLRHHDHVIQDSVLVAEWPPRTNVPDPDLMAIARLSSADPVLTQCEHGRKPVVVRLERPSRSF